MEPKCQSNTVLASAVHSPDYTQAGLSPRCMATEPKAKLAVQVGECEREVVHSGPDGEKPSI